jgi:hypothetical protein
MVNTALKGISHTFASPFSINLNSYRIEEIEQNSVFAKEDPGAYLPLPFFNRFIQVLFTNFIRHS